MIAVTEDAIRPAAVAVAEGLGAFGGDGGRPYRFGRRSGGCEGRSGKHCGNDRRDGSRAHVILHEAPGGSRSAEVSETFRRWWGAMVTNLAARDVALVAMRVDAAASISAARRRRAVIADDRGSRLSHRAGAGDRFGDGLDRRIIDDRIVARSGAMQRLGVVMMMMAVAVVVIVTAVVPAVTSAGVLLVTAAVIVVMTMCKDR